MRSRRSKSKKRRSFVRKTPRKSKRLRSRLNVSLIQKAEDRIDVLKNKIKQLKKKLSHKANVKDCYIKKLSKKREEKRSRRVGGK